MKTTEYIIGFIIGMTILLVIGGAVWHIIITQSIRDTEEMVERQAKACCLADTPTMVLATTDAWDNALHLEVTNSPKLKAYEVTSGGPDKEFGTGDDISFTKLDFNKSAIAGEWAGAKLKEAGKGLIKGFKKKSKFEED